MIKLIMIQKKFEDTRGVTRSRKSKKNGQYGEMKKDKGTFNDLQNTTQKTEDRATRKPIKYQMLTNVRRKC